MFKILTRHSVQHLAPHSFVRHVLLLAGGTALGQIVVALSSPALTRLYSPEQLGLLAIFVSVLSPVLSLAALRYEVAIVLPRRDEIALQLLYLSLGLVAVTSILTGIAVLTLGRWMAAVLNVPELSHYLWLLPLSVFAGGIFQSLTYWGIRRRQFKSIGQARLSQSLVLVATQLGMGLLSVVPLGLLLGDAASRAAGSTRLARDVFHQARNRDRPDWDSINGVARRYKRFPQFSVGPSVLNSLSLQLPSILLSAQFGATPVGLFAIGQRILGLPLNLVSSSIGQVFLGDVAGAAHAGPQALARRFTRAVRILAAVGSAVVIPAALVAPLVFGSLFGEQWAVAGQYLQLLSPMLIAQFVAAPMGVILDVLERQDLHLIREVARISLLLLAWWISQGWSEGPMAMVGVLSIASATGYLLGLLLVRRAVSQAETLGHEQDL